MPLYLRSRADHFPDDHAARRFTGDRYVVLCGNLIAGHVEPITAGRSEGSWQWGAALGGGLSAGGTASSLDAGRVKVAEAFRALIVRADLAERPDAKAGPPVYDPPPPSANENAAHEPPQHDPAWDADHPVVIQQPRHFAVRSGELLIGVLDELARAPNAGQWTWAMSGTRPNPPGFVWRGVERTLDEARAAHAACWTEWLRWAGLEQVKPIRWRSA